MKIIVSALALTVILTGCIPAQQQAYRSPRYLPPEQQGYQIVPPQTFNNSYLNQNQVRQPVQCNSQRVGNQVYTSCY